MWSTPPALVGVLLNLSVQIAHYHDSTRTRPALPSWSVDVVDLVDLFLVNAYKLSGH